MYPIAWMCPHPSWPCCVSFSYNSFSAFLPPSIIQSVSFLHRYEHVHTHIHPHTPISAGCEWVMAFPPVVLLCGDTVGHFFPSCFVLCYAVGSVARRSMDESNISKPTPSFSHSLSSSLSSQLLYDMSKLLPPPVPITLATLLDTCKCGCVTGWQTDRDMVTLQRYSQNDNSI